MPDTDPIPGRPAGPRVARLDDLSTPPPGQVADLDSVAAGGEGGPSAAAALDIDRRATGDVRVGAALDVGGAAGGEVPVVGLDGDAVAGGGPLVGAIDVGGAAGGGVPVVGLDGDRPDVGDVRVVALDIDVAADRGVPVASLDSDAVAGGEPLVIALDVDGAAGGEVPVVGLDGDRAAVGDVRVVALDIDAAADRGVPVVALDTVRLVDRRPAAVAGLDGVELGAAPEPAPTVALDIDAAPGGGMPVVSLDTVRSVDRPAVVARLDGVDLGSTGRVGRRIDTRRGEQGGRRGRGRAEDGGGANAGALDTDSSRDGNRGGRGRGERRSARDAVQEPDADPVAVAREICLRLLTDRARTLHELATALRRKGVPDEAAAQVLGRFDEVGLIDDAAFAGQWVRSRHRFRGLGRRAIAQELRRKGVDEEVAGKALAEVDGEAEERRARQVVDKKLRTLRLDTADDRAVAARRLVGMLARKGYGAGVAYAVVRAGLAEHCAEADELDNEPPIDD